MVFSATYTIDYGYTKSTLGTFWNFGMVHPCVKVPKQPAVDNGMWGVPRNYSYTWVQWVGMAQARTKVGETFMALIKVSTRISLCSEVKLG